MYQCLIFVFKELALQMMLFVSAESTILSSQWVFPSLLPLFSVVSLTPRFFWEAHVGLNGCRAGLSNPWVPLLWAQPARSRGEEVKWGDWGRAVGTAPQHSPLPHGSSPSSGQGGILASLPITVPGGSLLLSLLSSP